MNPTIRPLGSPLVPHQPHDRHVAGRSFAVIPALLLAGCWSPPLASPPLASPRAPDARPEPAHDVAADAPADLCDGSAGPRLIFNNPAGIAMLPGAFPGYGTQAFFVIDGHCRYWAGESFLKGIHTGTLSPARAQSIAALLHHQELSRLTSIYKGACPDSPPRTVSDGVNNVRCSCNCELAGSPEYDEIFRNVSPIFRELFDTGTPAQLPIRVLMNGPETDGRVSPIEPVPWPLAWSPALLQGQPSETGRLVIATDELMALRQLRQAAPDPDFRLGIRVLDAAGAMFVVQLYDEPPALVTAAVQAAR